MGPYPGGQAQYVRVPYADFNALLLPPGKEHEADFILLAVSTLVHFLSTILTTWSRTSSRLDGTALSCLGSKRARVSQSLEVDPLD
jgi:hypothetical protein